MADRSPVVAPHADRPFRCARCGSWIEVCAFCEEADCASVICYRCLRRELRQSLDHPHPHGG
jgi:hypothetical protein